MTGETQDLGVEEQGGVLTVTLRRPAKLNAITVGMRASLAEAVARFGSRDDLRVLVLRAEGRYFSAGMDITGMGSMPRTGVEQRYEYRKLHTLFDELERIEKPVVVAIQGPCLGGALEMSLSCDFRLASSRATFGLPEIKIGVLPGSGGTSRLTQLVGRGWARWLVMANQTVSAESALQMGLVQAVYPEETFDESVDAFVESLLGLPQEVVGLAKVAINLSAALDPASARDVERVANTWLLASDDHRDAVARFRARSAEKKQS